MNTEIQTNFQQSDQAEYEPVIGADGASMPAKSLTLGVEKFRRPVKHYRLIWIDGDDAWLCEEDQTEYRRKGAAVEAGQDLVKRFGARRFSELTR